MFLSSSIKTYFYFLFVQLFRLNKET